MAHKEKNCLYCGAEIPKNSKKIKFCSEKCRDKYESIKNKMKKTAKPPKPKILSAEQVLPDPITEKRSNAVWKRHLEFALDEAARRELDISTKQWERYKEQNRDTVDEWKSAHRKKFFEEHKRTYTSPNNYY